MKDIEELKTKYSCQQTKDSVSENQKEYIEFVINCLEKEDFVKAMNELLPFDNRVFNMMYPHFVSFLSKPFFF